VKPFQDFAVKAESLNRLSGYPFSVSFRCQLITNK
jgi:hypothetical protein